MSDEENMDNVDILNENEGMDDCGNVEDITCKYLWHEPYMTPNNYDIYFDHTNIPININIDKPYSLLKKLQRLMPLTKIIHLNLHSETLALNNNYNLHTRLRVTFITKDEWSDDDILIEKVEVKL